MYTNDDTPDSKNRDLFPKFHQLFDELFPVQCSRSSEDDALDQLSNTNNSPHPFSSTYHNNNYPRNLATSPSSSIISEPELSYDLFMEIETDPRSDPRYANAHPYSGGYPANWYRGPPPPSSVSRYHHSSSSNRFSSSQGESSLSNLTEKFIQLLDEYSSPHGGGGELDLNIAVHKLNVQKRRLYDITNVLEGVGLIKKDRNQVAWADRSIMEAASVNVGVSDDGNSAHESTAVAALQSEISEIKAHGNYIDSCIEKLSDSVREYTKCKKESLVEKEEKEAKPAESHLFVTKHEIAALQAYHNDTVIAIRAPSGTNLEVPNPDEGMRPGMRRFQIYLTGPGPDAGEVKVMVLQNSNETRSYQRPNHYGYAYPPYGYNGARPNYAPSNGHPAMQKPTQPSKVTIKSPESANESNVKPMEVVSSQPQHDSMIKEKPVLPRLPLPQSFPKRPRFERSASTSAVGKPDNVRSVSNESRPALPPRPSLKRRSSEPFVGDKNVLLDPPVPKRAKVAPGTSRKPLKAALKKSPCKSPPTNFILSPIKGRNCSFELQSPCTKKGLDGLGCGPSPISRTNDLLNAPLESPGYATSPVYFAASPVPNSKLSNTGRLAAFPASPFPFSPNLNMHTADFSPFISSPSISRMERQMQMHSEKDEPGATAFPSLF